MVDSVTTQIIEQGPRYAVIKFTDVSDGTGEVAVLKVDVSALTFDPLDGPVTNVRIEDIWYDIFGMQVEILWDATVDQMCWILTPGQFRHEFRTFGGIPNNAGAGKTGDILFTTIGASAGDSYSIILRLIKGHN